MLLGEIIGVVIPAAGVGLRLGGDRPKQFQDLMGTPVLLRTVLAFQRSPLIDVIVVAARQREIQVVEDMLKTHACRKVVAVVRGGRHRQDSVWNALKEIAKHAAGIVLVHDAVRPFVTEKMIMDVSMAVLRYGGALVAVRPKDTLKVSAGEYFADRTLPREGAWLAQTPQAFRLSVIMDAFRRARAKGCRATDEAALLEGSGVKVKILEGSYDNIKITTPEDLDLARLIMRRSGAKRRRLSPARARNGRRKRHGI